MRHEPTRFGVGVTVTTEPVTITKYVHEGEACDKDGKPAGHVRFAVWNGKFHYKDNTGEYEGEIIDYNKTFVEGFDYGLNVEGIEQDEDADQWECRWYDFPSRSQGSMTIVYSPAFQILVVTKR